MEKRSHNEPVQQNEDEVYYGVGSFLWEVIKVFFWAMIIIIPIRLFLFQPFFVQGASMEPNFEDGDYLIVNEFGYKTTSVDAGSFHLMTFDAFRDLQRGDVVVFRYPRNPQQFFIKRIIGLPGEKVQIENGKATIYNKDNPQGLMLNETYLPSGRETSGVETISLTDQQYFVMGDNRQYSSDSRVWGPLPKNLVIGKVLLRAWPLNKMEVL